MVDQVRGGLRHPASDTGGAEASAFAAEGHQQTLSTARAVHPSEPAREHSAAEVAAQLALDEHRQARTIRVGGERQEGLEMLREELVQ